MKKLDGYNFMILSLTDLKLLNLNIPRIFSKTQHEYLCFDADPKKNWNTKC